MIRLLPLLLLAACEVSGLGRADVPCSRDPRASLQGRQCDWTGDLASTSTGSCSLGTLQCDGTRVTCVGAAYPSAEACDSLDNDCDGRTDEWEDSDVEFCYSGEQQFLLYGACRPGVLVCAAGQMVCRGEVLPTREVCNRVDDDCDGTVDWSDESVELDVVVIVDRSWSMVWYMPAIKGALESFQFFPGVRVWLVDLPSVPDEAEYSHGLNEVCHPDQTPPVPSCSPGDLTLASQLLAADLGSEELSYDAIVDVLDGTIPVAWTPGADRTIVFLGDEPAQSARALTEVAVLARLGSTRLVSFLRPEHYWAYDDLGDVYSLLNPDLRVAVESVVLPQCSP